VDGQLPRQAENFIHSALFHHRFAWHEYGDDYSLDILKRFILLQNEAALQGLSYEKQFIPTGYQWHG
jgi:hypothetical protein